MNIQQIRVMFELQGLNNLSKQSVNIQDSKQNLFQDVLNEAFLSMSNNSNSSNQLGSIQKLQEMNSLYTTNTIHPQNVKPISGVQTITAPANIEEIISRAAETHDVPKELVKSIIKHESNFNPNAVSHAGASGLMQLMPSTARGLGVTNIFDPEQNVFAGTKYIKQMLDRYDGNVKLALAAYNAGPGNVDKHNGIPPFKETMNYVRKVSDSYFA